MKGKNILAIVIIAAVLVTLVVAFFSFAPEKETGKAISTYPPGGQDLLSIPGDNYNLNFYLDKKIVERDLTIYNPTTSIKTIIILSSMAAWNGVGYAPLTNCYELSLWDNNAEINKEYDFAGNPTWELTLTARETKKVKLNVTARKRNPYSRVGCQIRESWPDYWPDNTMGTQKEYLTITAQISYDYYTSVELTSNLHPGNAPVLLSAVDTNFNFYPSYQSDIKPVTIHNPSEETKTFLITVDSFSLDINDPLYEDCKFYIDKTGTGQGPWDLVWDPQTSQACEGVEVDVPLEGKQVLIIKEKKKSIK